MKISYLMMDRVTIRLKPHQLQCLKELKEAFGTSYSMLIRMIICDFLTKNEEVLDNIVENKNIDKYGNACSFVFDFSNVD